MNYHFNGFKFVRTIIKTLLPIIIICQKKRVDGVLNIGLMCTVSPSSEFKLNIHDRNCELKL